MNKGGQDGGYKKNVICAFGVELIIETITWVLSVIKKNLWYEDCLNTCLKRKEFY